MEKYVINDSIFLFQLICAGLCGTALGVERQSRMKSAGVRTHFIVSVASALMMIISKYGFFDVDKYDAARIASQVVSGIGFLGTGLIFIKNNSVNGLTTAAGIWATAGIGLAMGAGLYAVAICGTLLIVIVQILMYKDAFLNKDHLTITFEVSLEDSFNTIREIRNCLERFKLEVQNVEIVKKSRSVIVRFYTVVPVDFEREHLEDLIFDDERVRKIEM